MNRQTFERQLNASQHVVDWRRVELGNSTPRYMIETTFRDTMYKGSIFGDVEVCGVYIYDAPYYSLPDVRDARSRLTRWLVPEKKIARLKFEVEL